MTNLILSIPQYFTIFGVKIYFYGIISALSYLLGIVMTCVNAKKRNFKVDDIITLACYVIPFAIIGARLYYVLFRLDYFTSFWQIFDLRSGGLAFYGGMIGGALAVLLYCAIHKKNFLALLDIIAPSLILAQSLGRWGNFFNQEAYGYIVTDTDLQWFPFAVYIENIGEWHLATFFYESMWDLLTYITLQILISKVKFKNNGMIASYYLILYGFGRMFIEGLRTDSLYLGSIRISQLLSAVFIVVGVVFVLVNTIKNHRNKDSFDIIRDVVKKDF